MKILKKINPVLVGICVLMIGLIAGCDNYERKGEVIPAITVNIHSLSLFVGESAELKASPENLAITWTSEDAEVATVSNTGVVTGVGTGNTFIVASSGNMTCRIPVSSIVRIPLTDFNLGTTSLLLFTRERIQYIPTHIPSNANDASYPFWTSRNSNIATVDYKGEIIAISAGSTDIDCRINNIVKTIHVDALDSYPMFLGPHRLRATMPYSLRFIDFDFGGEGVAFHDNDGGNSGGNNHRANNGDALGGAVDIGGDLAVGWTSGGEWLKYTVIVYDAGDYNVSLDIAGTGISTIHFEVDGEDVTGPLAVPSTGAWDAWRWHDLEVPLTFTEGMHSFIFFIEAASSNFRTMRFTYKE